jgi:hypothetical protein
MNKIKIQLPSYGVSNLIDWGKELFQLGIDPNKVKNDLGDLINQRHVLDLDITLLDDIVSLELICDDNVEQVIEQLYTNIFLGIIQTHSVEVYEDTISLEKEHFIGGHVNIEETEIYFKSRYINIERDEFHLKIKPSIDTQIDLFEFGVMAGESMQTWLELFPDSSCTFHGFDTFDGIRGKWVTKDSNGYKLVRTFNMMSVNSLTPIETGIIKDNRVTFYKGLIQDTLKYTIDQIDNSRPRLYHFDLDTYAGTLFSLCQIYHYLKPGDLVIFDEFWDPINEWQAWNDFNRSHMFLDRWNMLFHNGTQACFIVNA